MNALDKRIAFHMEVPSMDVWVKPSKEWWARWPFLDSVQPKSDMGYYVLYEDGYTSWSPSAAFEEGYSLLGSTDGKDS